MYCLNYNKQYTFYNSYKMVWSINVFFTNYLSNGKIFFRFNGAMVTHYLERASIRIKDQM